MTEGHVVVTMPGDPSLHPLCLLGDGRDPGTLSLLAPCSSSLDEDDDVGSSGSLRRVLSDAEVNIRVRSD